MTEKIRVSYNIKKSISDDLNNIPRSELPNKSKLIEELLEKWLGKRKKNMEKEVS